jgi:hypothetical protein
MSGKFIRYFGETFSKFEDAIVLYIERQLQQGIYFILFMFYLS